MAQVGTTSRTGKVSEGNEKDQDPESSKKTSKQAPRKRVSQACDRCRSRKDKCDGRKPACSTCTTNGRECSYDANVKKRGLPEGYVRGMEKLWGLAIREVEDVEDNMLSALSGDDEPLRTWNDESISENLVELWRKSHIFRGLERLLSSLSLEPTPDNGKRKRDDSDVQTSKKGSTKDPARLVPPALQNEVGYPDWQPSGVGDRSFDIRPPVDGQSPFTNQPTVGENVDTYDSILSPSNRNGQPSNTTPATSQEILDLPSEAWHLLDVYFSYTHSWLPIIEKHDLLRISYQYSQSRNSTPQSGSGDHAVLWAAIAYAKFQHRAINNIPRALGPVGEKVWTAERMYSQARTFIPNEEGNLEIGHVQALLILTLANIGTDHMSRAWSLVGQAVRIAIDLQLDRPKDHILSSSKSQSKSRAKHVFLGCFVLDTIVAARLGRRPHLRSDEIDVVGLLEEDGLEEWDPWTDCLNVRRSSLGSSRAPASILSTFNRLVQILRILNEASCVTTSTSNTRQVSTRLIENLHAWAQEQPLPSQFDTDTMQSRPALSLLPHQYHLHTVFFTTLAASQLLLASQHASTDLDPAAKSARQATDLLSQYSKTFGLLIVPPTYEYYVKTAYDLVNAIQSSIDNTHIKLNDWRRSLDYCLATIEPAWPVFEVFRTSKVSESTSQQRRESQVAFDLISGSNRDDESPLPGKTPQSLNSYETTSQPSPHAFGAQAQAAEAMTPDFPSESSQWTRSFGQQSSGNGLPQNPMNIYENAHATYGMSPSISHTQPSAAMREAGQFRTSSHTIAMSNPYSGPRLQHHMSMSSDVEMQEPVFGDLMRLDATEWTGNWDQSLVNLGFTDQDNMNQAFNTFCQEPDPLHPNTVFQRLVVTSNAEAANFFDNSAFEGMATGIGLGLGSFGGFGFGDENEGIEAGQILQALSAAGDQSAGRPNR